MTYNPNVPNASETPSLFPAQGSANFTRLRKIINNDHIFNDVAPVPVGGLPTNDGRHRQVTLKNRNRPTQIPTGTNSILYSSSGNAPETGQANQLFYWDGTDYSQLTPVGIVIPLAITGKSAAAISPNANLIIYPDPGFKYTGIAIGVTVNTNETGIYLITRSGANVANVISSAGGSIFDRPNFSFSGNDLRIGFGGSSGPLNVVWTLNIIKLIA